MKSCCFPPWLYSSRGSCSRPQGCSSNRATNKRRKSPAVPTAGLFAWIVATMPMPLRPLGLEVHGDAVDAIAQMRRRGPVVEHVAEMAAAAAAMHLSAHHPIAAIGRALDRTLNRIVEARPAGAALEFLLRHEQRLAAPGADERAGALLIVERAAAGRFGPVPAQHLVLLGREQTAPLLVRVSDRKALVVHGSSSARVRRLVGSGGVAIEQLDRHALGRAQEGDAHPGPHRGGVAGELDALGLELGDHRVDAADREAEVIEALVGRDRRRIDAIAGRDRRDEDVGAAELEVDARLALLHGADHLGAEHAFIPLGGRFGIGGTQMDVVPGVLDHVRSPSVAAWSSVARIARRRNATSERGPPAHPARACRRSQPSSAKISSLCWPSVGGAESMRGPPWAKVNAASGTPKPPSTPAAPAWR